MEVMDPFPRKFHRCKHFIEMSGICRHAEAVQIGRFRAESLALVLATYSNAWSMDHQHQLSLRALSRKE